VARKKIPEQDDQENPIREVDVGHIILWKSTCYQMSHLLQILHRPLVGNDIS